MCKWGPESFLGGSRTKGPLDMGLNSQGTPSFGSAWLYHGNIRNPVWNIVSPIIGLAPLLFPSNPSAVKHSSTALFSLCAQCVSATCVYFRLESRTASSQHLLFGTSSPDNLSANNTACQSSLINVILETSFLMCGKFKTREIQTGLPISAECNFHNVLRRTYPIPQCVRTAAVSLFCQCVFLGNEPLA